MATHKAPPRLTLGPADDGRPLTANEFVDASHLEPWKSERAAGRLILGVREYVIVDRYQRIVTVRTHALDGYAECILWAGVIDTSPLLPGLAIPLAEVLGP